MFTGIVAAIGRISSMEPRGGDLRLGFTVPASLLEGTRVGDSVSVSGVCLTVVACGDAHFAADLSRETLARTTLGALRVGDGVNLELALRLSDRLGGHLVSGHVDGLGEVVAVVADARAQRWTFRAPPDLMRYVAPKGSITIDGVSLTVNAVDGDRFEVALIPHTLAVTTFGERALGAAVNLEVDLLARYLERLLDARGDGVVADSR
jgi:riboflavin synthase